MYTRKCQECGHRQVNTDPAQYKNDRWRDVKCKVCKSPALDYGSNGWEVDKATGNLVRKEEE